MGGRADVQGRARARPWLSQRAREELTAYLFIMPWVIGFLVFTAFAMAFSLYISFSETDLLSISKFVGIKNYQQALSNDKLFFKALGVTAWYTLLVVPLGTIIALSIALMLNQKIRPIGVWRTVYYLPALVSGVAVALLWGWVLNPEFGLVNLGLKLIGVQGPRWFASEEWAVPGMVLVALWGTGTNMVLYLAGLQSIPTEVQEAARIDGAGPWQVFRNVTLPLLTPTVFFNVITSIIGSFQVFNIVVILTAGGPNNATLSMVYYLYNEGFRLFNFGYASAIAWLLFAIILFFTLLVMRSSAYWVHYEGGLRR
ncbi:MAG TPA: sugar ABC transporter permease [Chloroflexota bacterium]|nr:sugar ABC transporter permease [Chloroflexota bacterium]